MEEVYRAKYVVQDGYNVLLREGGRPQVGKDLLKVMFFRVHYNKEVSKLFRRLARGNDHVHKFGCENILLHFGKLSHNLYFAQYLLAIVYVLEDVLY